MMQIALRKGFVHCGNQPSLAGDFASTSNVIKRRSHEWGNRGNEILRRTKPKAVPAQGPRIPFGQNSIAKLLHGLPLAA